AAPKWDAAERSRLSPGCAFLDAYAARRRILAGSHAGAADSALFRKRVPAPRSPRSLKAPRYLPQPPQYRDADTGRLDYFTAAYFHGRWRALTSGTWFIDFSNYA